MLIEKFRLTTDGVKIFSPASMGWCEHIINAEPTEADVKRLADALANRIEANLDGEDIGSAIAALGALRDATQHELYCRVLEHQTLVALQSSGADLGRECRRSSSMKSAHPLPVRPKSKRAKRPTNHALALARVNADPERAVIGP